MRHSTLLVVVLLSACEGGGDATDARPAVDAGVIDAAPAGECAQHAPLRQALFGDLHVHTSYSFDAWIFGTRNDPDAAYRFARGAPAPVGAPDAPIPIQLSRPLDFAAVTDHAEYLAEVDICLDPSAAGHDAEICRDYRAGDTGDFVRWGLQLLRDDSDYLPGLCDRDDVRCLDRRPSVWGRVREAAERHHDPCAFTTFVAYEWTNNTAGRSMHRNVVFRGAEVPTTPTSYFEARTAPALWASLRADCLEAGTGCDVLAIPHNANLSNGGLFLPRYPGADTIEEERAQARERAFMEPVVEMFQAKGGSECIEGIGGVVGAPDELCAVEQLRNANSDCDDALGTNGILNAGCTTRHDFVRTALLTGFQEADRLGVDPFGFGFIGSTDTHNGTPGAVAEDRYEGSTGNEAPAERRLVDLGAVPLGFNSNPGGLAGVWATENTRDAIFDALRRKEVFATSGPRIVPRFFGGALAPGLCEQADAVALADAAGTSMGGELPPDAGPPRFLAMASANPESAALQRLEIVKGWLNDEGVPEYAVHVVAGDADNGADVDLDTCQPRGEGARTLCATWTDADFDPARRAYYYARVVENPTCRWSARDCLAFADGEKPEMCDDPRHRKVIQEMAWTSPIRYAPPD